MNSLLRVLLAALASILVVQPAVAGRDEPIQNPKDVPIAWNAEGQPSLERLQHAIMAGCAQRGWQCAAEKPGKIRAVLHLRQHMAEASITFDTKNYSVTYVDSAELRYNGAKHTIHRKYNLWIANLISDINAAIAAIQ